MGRRGSEFDSGVTDNIVRYVLAFCRQHKVAVLERGSEYRTAEGSIYNRKELLSLIVAKAPTLEGRKLEIRRLDFGLTAYELTVPIFDPFEASVEVYCDLAAEDPRAAWDLARVGALLPFKYSDNPAGNSDIVDENTANLLCFAAQIKRRLADEEDLGPLTGVLNSWGASGTGKSLFLHHLCSPFRKAGLVETLADVKKLLLGFHGGSLSRKLILFGDDLAPISGDLHEPFKAFTTLPTWKADEKFKIPGEVRIRSGIVVSANKPPEVQYADEAFARRLFNIAWPDRIALVVQEEFANKVLPAWDVDTFWKIAPRSVPFGWRELVERSRSRLYKDSLVNTWLDEYTYKDLQAVSLSLKFMFQHFMAVAEEGNWYVRHVSDKVFAKELKSAGIDLRRGPGGWWVDGLVVRGHKLSSQPVQRADQSEVMS